MFHGFVVFFHDILQNIHMPEVIMVEDIDFSDHTQIFNRQNRDFSLLQFIQTNAAREY
jgi:hypothetical protein